MGRRQEPVAAWTQVSPAKRFWKSVTTYIEPFIGGGAFFLLILSRYTHLQRIIINDANEALINTYKVIRDNPDELIDTLMTFKTQYQSMKDEEGRKDYYYSKREAFNAGDATPVERAAYLIFWIEPALTAFIESMQRQIQRPAWSL